MTDKKTFNEKLNLSNGFMPFEAIICWILLESIILNISSNKLLYGLELSKFKPNNILITRMCLLKVIFKYFNNIIL